MGRPLRSRGPARLALAVDKARAQLGWTPAWDLAQTLDATARGYAAPPDEMPAVLRSQISAYTRAAGIAGNAWAPSPAA